MLRDFSWFEPTPRNFPVDPRRLRIWRRWGKVYRRTGAYQLLQQIEAARELAFRDSTNDMADIRWLLPFRSRFRNAFAGFSGEAEIAHYYMAYCCREMIPVCIWLIGRCASRFQLHGVSEFRRDPSPQIRKHVAKALRRLEAWHLLDEMATLYPEDAKVQYFAKTKVPHRPFKERLTSYIRSVDDSHAPEVATPSRMPYWAIENAWSYTPPKSRWFIRRMLRRIRHWVRWGVS